jgi:hypothetical protein
VVTPQWSQITTRRWQVSRVAFPGPPHDRRVTDLTVLADWTPSVTVA